MVVQSSVKLTRLTEHAAGGKDGSAVDRVTHVSTRIGPSGASKPDCGGLGAEDHTSIPKDPWRGTVPVDIRTGTVIDELFRCSLSATVDKSLQSDY